MKKILMLLSLRLILAQSVCATLITFDDLSDAGAGSAIATGYSGFYWDNFRVLNTGAYEIKPSGYLFGTVSGQNVTYNAWSDPATISRARRFDLNSAFLTAAWNDGLQVEVVGSFQGAILYDTIYVIDASSPTLVTFNYLGVDSVRFSSTGGTQRYGMGTHFAMDNLEINTSSAIPEQETWLAGALLLAPLGLSAYWKLRRA